MDEKKALHYFKLFLQLMAPVLNCKFDKNDKTVREAIRCFASTMWMTEAEMNVLYEYFFYLADVNTMSLYQTIINNENIEDNDNVICIKQEIDKSTWPYLIIKGEFLTDERFDRCSIFNDEVLVEKLTTLGDEFSLTIKRTRLLAFLMLFGIGMEEDIESAEKHFTECAYYGDEISMFCLQYIYKKCGNNKLATRWLNICNMVIARNDLIYYSNKYDQETIDMMNIIISNRTEHGNNNNTKIDVNLITYLEDDNILYNDKMFKINPNLYQEMNHKEERRIGFIPDDVDGREKKVKS